MLLIYCYIFLIPRHSLSTFMRGPKMNTDQEQFKDEKETRQGLPDDEIIELVDVVMKGESPQDVETDDLIELVDVVMKGNNDPDDMAPLFDNEDGSTEATFIEGKAEEASSELSRALEKETTEDRDDTYESLDFDFETSEDFEEPDTDAFTELPQDDLAEAMASLEDTDETDEFGPTAISEELPAISTERLEDIITEAVKDVVERVTRETMSEVAEKVIKDAIEGLKQSLEPPPA